MSPIFTQNPTLPEMKLPLRDRKNIWELWKKDKVQGNHSCTQCHNVSFCTGERYDLLVCWYCFFPDVEGLSPLDERRAQRERDREDPDYKIQIQRKPAEEKGGQK